MILINRSFVIAVIFSIILLGCQTTSAPRGPRNPEFSIQSAEIVNMSLTGSQLLCKVEVKNPNSYEIPLTETSWRFFLNNNSFRSGTIKNDLSIKARETAVIEIPVDVSYHNVITTYSAFRGRQSIGYRIAVNIKTDIPDFENNSWNVEHQGDFLLPQLPRLVSHAVRIGEVSRSGVEVFVNINFDNPNPFVLPSPDIDYIFNIDGNPFIRGNVSDKPLAAKTTTSIELKLRISFTDLFRNFPSLASQRNAPSFFQYDCDFGLPALGNIALREIPFTLPLRR